MCVHTILIIKKKKNTHIIKRTVNRTRGTYIFHLTGYRQLGPGCPSRLGSLHAEEKESKLVSIKQIRQDWARVFSGENYAT